MDAWSPEGYRHFCLALSISVLLAEFVKSVVDLFPGTRVNFVVYNAWGVLCVNLAACVGKRLQSRKNMWFLNGFLTSGIILLVYSALFSEAHWVFSVVYGVELVLTLAVANYLRRYESPERFVELARARGQVAGSIN